MRFAMKTVFGLAAILALALITPVAALGDDAQKAPLTQVFVAAAKSMDAIEHVGKDLGIELPPFLTTKGLEQSLPFIGAGGLASDKPGGIVMLSAPGMDPEQSMAFVLPVKAGFATVDSLKALGGQPMADHPNTVVINGTALRRTADYLIFSQNSAVANAVDTEAVVNAVKTPADVVRFVLSMKGLRTAMPDQIKKFYESIEKDKNKNDEAAQAGAAIVADTIRHWVETIDQVDLGLNLGDQGVRVALTATPVQLPAMTAGNRPGMPASAIMNVNVAVALGEAFPSVRALGDKLMAIIEKGQDPAKKLPEAQLKSLRSAVQKLVVLGMDSSATSVGFEMTGETPVVYLVQHWTNQPDAIADVKEIVGSLKGLIDNPAHGIELQERAVEAGKILRVMFKDNAKVEGCVEIAQRGGDVFIAAFPGDATHIETLLAAPNDGQIDGLVSGWVDLAKLVEQFAKVPGSPFAGLPADSQKQLATLVNGQKIHIGVVKAGEAVTLEVRISHALMTQIPKLVELFGGK